MSPRAFIASLLSPPRPQSRRWRWSGPCLLTLLTACGSISELTGTGGNTNLNLSSPYAEINLAAPAQLPSPTPGSGADGIATGSSFSSAVGAENVQALANRGRFRPNWAEGTKPSQAHLAWATYWLDMTTKTAATQIVMDWLAQPRAQDVWVGLANWNNNSWTWRRLEVASTLTPPSLTPFIRNSDNMLACTILVMGTQDATLNQLGTDVTDPSPPPPGNQGLLNPNAHLGVNLGNVSDFDPSAPFVDVFKTARSWISQDLVGGGWDNGLPIHTDADGWITSLEPGQAVAALMMVGVTGVYPAGEYICLYDGQGTIEFRDDASITWSTPGRMGVQINPSGNMVRLRITDTNPADYIRNIRLIMPGFEDTYDTQPFHPDFLASLSDFDVLRFMDWGRTNYSTVTTWQDRPTPSSYTQARVDGPHAGVALEYMIDLSNANLSDAWICIPYLADDNYVRNAATLIRDRLDPRLRVFVEYSNEVWNSIFPAAGYAKSQGLALGLSTNDFTAQLRYYSQRAQEVHAIFAAEFATQPDRLVRVIAGQSTNPWVGTTVMDWDAQLGAADANTASSRFDSYATAPYFGGYLGRLPQADTTANMTLTELLSACDADSLANNGPGGFTETNAQNATSRGLNLISYEGGQHLVGVGAAKDNVILTDLFTAANRDMGMRQIYSDDLRRWDASGGGLFMTFSHISPYSKHGNWGILEYQGQNTATAPKFLGLMDWLAEVTATP